ncbi:hypothetical protein [Gemmatimonas sp.]|jgi:AraC-like DNA-binding protein
MASLVGVFGSDLYADQAHFIHAFRDATGYTPVQYRKRFGSAGHSG